MDPAFEHQLRVVGGFGEPFRAARRKFLALAHRCQSESRIIPPDLSAPDLPNDRT